MPDPNISSFSPNEDAGFNFFYITASDYDRIELWRQYAGQSPVCITRTYHADLLFAYDYTPFHGIPALYWAKAVKDSTGLEDTSDARTVTQSFGGIYLGKVTKAANTNLSGTFIHLTNLEGSQRTIQVASETLLLPANDKPIIEVSTTVQRSWRIPVLITSLTDGTRELLNGFINNHDVLCCRDDRSRRMFGVLYRTKENLDLTGDYPYELFEVDYTETVRAA